MEEIGVYPTPKVVDLVLVAIGKNLGVELVNHSSSIDNPVADFLSSVFVA